MMKSLLGVAPPSPKSNSYPNSLINYVKVLHEQLSKNLDAFIVYSDFSTFLQWLLNWGKVQIFQPNLGKSIIS
jgi:hypothetical protein